MGELPTKSFAVDAASERTVARFRLAAGLFAAMAAVAIALMHPSPIGVLALLVCAGMAAFLILSYRRTMRQSARADDEALTLTTHGLAYSESGKRIEIAWSEIESVAVDEERVTVRLKLASGADRHIEPRYQGIAIDALADSIDAYRTQRGS